MVMKPGIKQVLSLALLVNLRVSLLASRAARRDAYQRRDYPCIVRGGRPWSVRFGRKSCEHETRSAQQWELAHHKPRLLDGDPFVIILVLL